jgi:hypothetical protein
MDLETETDVFIVMKKPIPLKVEFAEHDGICSTKEGKVVYKQGDAILTGTRGEQWPVQREKFEEIYQVVDAGKKLYAKKSIYALGKEMGESFSVKVFWNNNSLIGKPGDWLIQYEHGSFGVVDKEIFEETYEIRGKRL